MFFEIFIVVSNLQVDFESIWKEKTWFSIEKQIKFI